MKTTNFNLRGINHEIMVLLKNEAHKQDTSVNLLILKLVSQGIGYHQPASNARFHDLDHLAGTWSEKEANQFIKSISDFEQIDEDLWK